MRARAYSSDVLNMSIAERDRTCPYVMSHHGLFLEIIEEYLFFGDVSPVNEDIRNGIKGHAPRYHRLYANISLSDLIRLSESPAGQFQRGVADQLLPVSGYVCRIAHALFAAGHLLQPKRTVA